MFDRTEEYKLVQNVSGHDLQRYLAKKPDDESIAIYSSNIMHLVCSTDTTHEDLQYICKPQRLFKNALRKHFSFTVPELLSVDEYVLDVLEMRRNIKRHDITEGGDVIRAVGVIKALAHAQGYDFDTEGKDFMRRVCDVERTDKCGAETAGKIEQLAYSLSVAYPDLMLDRENHLIQKRVEFLLTSKRLDYCRELALHKDRYFKGLEDSPVPEHVD